MEIGYWLSSEEHAPRDLVRNATLAEDAGFEHVLISDHIHPWVSEQGHSAFVWAGIKAQQASPLKTVQMYGHTLYLDGQVTVAGLAYELATPLMVMAIGGLCALALKRHQAALI